jgi:hypothetical protein
MITLDHLLLEQTVLDTHFACDLARCKGACCTLPGGDGAPLLEEEIPLLQGAIAAAARYLSERSRDHLERVGAVSGRPGARTVTCIDEKDCVFVRYEGDVAVCAIEKAWHAGESAFRKPLSCHLFPIRVKDFGGPYLRYERFEECGPGRARGEAEGTFLVDTVYDGLVRAFGENVAEHLKEAAMNGREEEQ